MTYAATESSAASGTPAELYLFTKEGAAADGALVAVEDWTYASQAERNLKWLKESDQAAAFDGGDNAGFGGNPLHIGVAYGGGLGGGGGYARHTRTFGPDDGLEPNTEYTVTVPVTLDRTPGFEDMGVIINSGTSGNGDAALPSGLSGNVVETVTSDANGKLTVRVGHFDLEFGMTGIVILIGTITIEGPKPEGASADSVGYTSADEPITYNGTTYYPAILARGELETGGQEVSGTDTTLILPRDHAVSQWFAEGNDERPIGVTMYRLHRSDLTAAVTPVRARVTQALFRENTCQLTIGPLALHTLNRSAPRDRWSPGCNHVLYGSRCKAIRILHTLQQAEVLAISDDGLEVTVEGVEDYVADYDDRDVFAGGYLAPAVGPSRSIRFSTGDVLSLIAPIPGLTVGSLVDVVEGCALTTDACINQFDNLVNFGGFPSIPSRNPMDPAGSGFA